MTKKFRTRSFELKTVRDGDTLRLRIRGPLANSDALADAIIRLLRETADSQEATNEVRRAA